MCVDNLYTQIAVFVDFNLNQLTRGAAVEDIYHSRPTLSRM